MLNELVVFEKARQYTSLLPCLFIITAHSDVEMTSLCWQTVKIPVVCTFHVARSHTGLLCAFPVVFGVCFKYIWVKLHSLPIRKSAVWPHQLQFSTCVTPYINSAPHVRRHSCRPVPGHSQHAPLWKALHMRTTVYDSGCLCFSKCVFQWVYAYPYVSHRTALPDTHVVTTKPVFGFYQRHQTALEEEHLVVGRWLILSFNGRN